MSMKPLTKKELKEYFQDYREAFPDWGVEHEVVLTRGCGPISQHIAFVSLSYGAYRPECTIHVTGPPGGSRLLHQMLDVKHRQVERRQHDTEWHKVLHAIEEQFVPNVRKPLDIEEVLGIAEEDAEHNRISNEQYLIGLATLNVHLGYDLRAIEWCDRAEASFKEFAASVVPSEGMLKDIEFARQLREAVRESRGREFLSEVADQPSD